MNSVSFYHAISFTHVIVFQVQHRMKPNIADLVVGTIYEKLENHSSVYEHPPVLGVTKNLFFLSHKEFEKAVRSFPRFQQSFLPFVNELFGIVTYCF